MSHIGEFDLIGRIAAACHPEGSCHPERSLCHPEGSCHPERSLCHPEHSSCHPERSEGSVPEEPGVTGIGDDCAIIPQRSGLDTLVTTDLLIEGRHFLLEDITPFELGWKSAAVNISDIAAMGGKPVASFLSIALPPSCHPERSEGSWIDEFIRGFNELSGRFGVPLLGGDTSASDDKLFINVTVLGECPHGQAVLRSGARPGDLVCVTGCLGDSAAGLKLILERTSGDTSASASVASGSSPVILSEAKNPDPSASLRMTSAVATSEKELIRRHYMPMPRVAEGQALAAVPGVHAMMDISDGIASDLRHILETSSADWPLRHGRPDQDLRHGQPDRPSLSAEIDLPAIPLSDELRQVCAERGWDPFELAVSGGEDYELLFTAAPGTELPDGCTVIGRIIDSRSVPGMTSGEPGMADGVTGTADGKPVIRWIGSDKDFKGFTHF